MGGVYRCHECDKDDRSEVLHRSAWIIWDFLETLWQIAACKAGIIKPDTTVVSMRQQPEAMEVDPAGLSKAEGGSAYRRCGKCNGHRIWV